MSFSKFREHRGQFDESMKTIVDVSSYNELLEHARKILWPWYVEVPRLEIKPYLFDDRPGWNADTYIVTIPGYGVFGFTNGSVDDIPV